MPFAVNVMLKISSVLRLDLAINMHIFVLRRSVYPIVMKLGKQFYIRMLAHLTGFLILNFGHVTLKRLYVSQKLQLQQENIPKLTVF